MQIYRCRVIATPLQRHQIKWFIFGFVISLILSALFGLLPLLIPSLQQANSWYQLAGPATGILFGTLPQCAGILIALWRYRLWDIDILINRSLVYAGLSASTLGVYVLIVFGASALLRAQNDLLFSVLATALIAVLFQPLRQRLQYGVNRLMYGDRNEPYRVLSRLGQRLEETVPVDAFLPTIVETVAHALKLPYVAIVWKEKHVLVGAQAAQVVAAFGAETGGGADTRVPLVHQGSEVGELVLSPRQRGEALTPADLRLVRDLAPQIGIAVHSARLTSDLQRSRERLVTAREEERRRLRRDLHDGLGSQLAALTLKLETARNRLGHDPLADTLLTDLTERTQVTVADIRRLVYALRPPALDELGMVPALHEQALQYAHQIHTTLEVPQRLPELSAAVEVAIFRIAQEALTNVIRHAQARTCSIRLLLDETTGILSLEILDDGHGLPPGRRSGVGLVSMRERAEELGGRLTLAPASPRGTRVLAQFPSARLDTPEPTNHHSSPINEGKE